MRRELTRIEPVTAANVVAILYAIFFSLFALLFLPFAAFVPFRDQAGNVVDSGPMVTFILMYPVFGAVGGWIGVFAMTHLYNFVARRVGGIRIEVASTDPAPGAV